jgi:allophanate hydrolase subunit 2
VSLRVVELAGFALVQDLGRPGHMHEGLAPGGALVPELLAAANAAAGNDPGAAAIEVYGALTLEAPAAATIATEDGARLELAPGGRARIAPRRDLRVRYVAIAGGIDAPVVLGSRSASLVAGIGRALAKGDVVSAATTPAASSTTTSTPTAIATPTAAATPAAAAGPAAAGEIAVVPGPDLERFSAEGVERFFSSVFVISARSDRIGTRLEGPAVGRVDRDDARSCPLVRGAIEIPRSGEPIVLGPDHPTTGGYPVLGVIARADQARFFARPLGAAVRFRKA